MVNRHRKDLRCHAAADGQRMPQRQIQVASKVAGQRVEVAAGNDVVLAQSRVHFVSGGSEGCRIDLDGEVRVVVADVGGRLWREPQAGDTPQAVDVGVVNGRSAGDDLVDPLQHQFAHQGLQFVHLGVGADGYDLGFTSESEVLQVIEGAFQLGIGED